MPEKSFNLFFEEKFIENFQKNNIKAFSSPFTITQKEDITIDKKLLESITSKSRGETLLISQFTAATQSDQYVPSIYRGYGYYDSFHRPGSYRTGTVVTNTYYYFKNSLFDIKTGQLLWSGLTKTWSPDSEDQIMDEIIEAVTMELAKLGYINKPT